MEEVRPANNFRVLWFIVLWLLTMSIRQVCSSGSSTCQILQVPRLLVELLYGFPFSPESSEKLPSVVYMVTNIGGNRELQVGSLSQQLQNQTAAQLHGISWTLFQVCFFCFQFSQCRLSFHLYSTFHVICSECCQIVVLVEDKFRSRLCG